jgi:hypothetical protein
VNGDKVEHRCKKHGLQTLLGVEKETPRRSVNVLRSLSFIIVKDTTISSFSWASLMNPCIKFLCFFTCTNMEDFKHDFSENSSRGMKEATVKDFLHVAVVSRNDRILVGWNLKNKIEQPKKIYGLHQ